MKKSVEELMVAITSALKFGDASSEPTICLSFCAQNDGCNAKGWTVSAFVSDNVSYKEHSSDSAHDALRLLCESLRNLFGEELRASQAACLRIEEVFAKT